MGEAASSCADPDSNKKKLGNVDTEFSQSVSYEESKSDNSNDSIIDRDDEKHFAIDDEKSQFIRPARRGVILSKFNNVPTHVGLYILGAAYGLQDVTAKIRRSVKNDILTIVANNKTFDDGWKGKDKSLVVIYRYGNTPNNAQVAFVKEKKQMSISPIASWNKHKVNIIDGELSILGAVYGLGDVTTKARKLIRSNSFSEIAENKIFGETWKGKKKSFVVVYAYDSVACINIVREDSVVYIVDTPPLSILGATYGPEDVTKLVQSLANTRNASIKATNDLFGNTWKGKTKSLAVVYRYKGYLPQIKYVKQGKTMWIDYRLQKVDKRKDNRTNQLIIQGAAYGLKPVTNPATLLIENNSLEVTANNKTFGEGWKGKDKSLTIVYRYGYQPHITAVCKEKETIKIQKQLPATTATYLNTKGLFHSNDQIIIQSVGTLKWSSNNKNELILSSSNPITFVITVRDIDNAIQLRNLKNNYILIRKNTGKLLFDTKGNIANDSNSFLFTEMDKTGKLKFSFAPNFVINVGQTWLIDAFHQEDDVFVYAMTAFDISFLKYGVNFQLRTATTSDTEPCRLPWISFVWQLTGGLVSSFGLIPFMNTNDVAPGILAIIKQNRRLSMYMNELLEQAIESNAVKIFGTAYASAIGFLAVMYEEGILWTIIKILLKQAEWYAVGWILTKLIGAIFLPEVEGAQLIAQFIVWQVQTVQSALELSACITSK